MKLRSIAVAVAALALTGNAFAQDVSSEKGKLSYYFGYDYGNNLAELTGRGEQLDINSVVKGLQDAYAKKQPAITADQLKPAVEAFQKREQGRAQAAKAEYEKAAAENKTKSDQFIAANKAKGRRAVPAERRPVPRDRSRQGRQADPGQHRAAGSGRSVPVRPAPDRSPSGPADSVDQGQRRRNEGHARDPAADAGRLEVGSHPAAGPGLRCRPAHPFPPNVAVQFEIKLVSVK